MRNKIVKGIKMESGFNPGEVEPFRPLQVTVEDGRFEECAKLFKSIVQKEKVLLLYKEKQSFEKPSVKKRRKSIEAAQRRFMAEVKQRQFESGELEKKNKKKQVKKMKNNITTNGNNSNG